MRDRLFYASRASIRCCLDLTYLLSHHFYDGLLTFPLVVLFVLCCDLHQMMRKNQNLKRSWNLIDVNFYFEIDSGFYFGV